MAANGIHLRGEMAGDEDVIDEVVCMAFGSMSEANLVRLLRQHCPTFDSRYSVTAWDGNRLVGHTLLTPVEARLMGRALPALLVAPVAVVPDRQREGIGARMLRYGHELGRREGHSLTFLKGHPAYYPRIGYRPCYGFAQMTIDSGKLPQPSVRFVRRPVQQSDLDWLVRRYAVEHAAVDFATIWGPTLGEWTLPIVDAVMWWTEDGQRAAYSVATNCGPRGKDYRLILADDPKLACEVIATARPKMLSHHPAGWLAREVVDPEWASPKVEASNAAMACGLQEGVLEPYLEAIASGRRQLGSGLDLLPFLLW
jgi:putative acetyltransferase